MEVLLTSFDLFKDVGGGQTFYRNLILRNPEVQFTYLRDTSPQTHRAPRTRRLCRVARNSTAEGVVVGRS